MCVQKNLMDRYSNIILLSINITSQSYTRSSQWFDTIGPDVANACAHVQLFIDLTNSIWLSVCEIIIQY